MDAPEAVTLEACDKRRTRTDMEAKRSRYETDKTKVEERRFALRCAPCLVGCGHVFSPVILLLPLRP